MEFRVVFSVGHLKSKFDFDDGRAALEFARTMRKHMVPDDCGYDQTVEIQLLDDENADADNG